MEFTKTEKIWFNGSFVNWDEAQVHVLAHGLHYGTGVFEGMRCYPTADGPAVFRLDAHMRRFANSASTMSTVRRQTATHVAPSPPRRSVS